MPKRKAGSEILGKLGTGTKWNPLNDILSKRPDDSPRLRQYSPENSRKRNFSPEIRSKSHVFKRRNHSAKKRAGENAE